MTWVFSSLFINPSRDGKKNNIFCIRMLAVLTITKSWIPSSLEWNLGDLSNLFTHQQFKGTPFLAPFPLIFSLISNWAKKDKNKFLLRMDWRPMNAPPADYTILYKPTNLNRKISPFYLLILIFLASQCLISLFG